MAHELQDWLDDPRVVVVVEWGDIVAHVLPAKRLTITIKVTGEDSRQLNFEYPKDLDYLTEGLC